MHHGPASLSAREKETLRLLLRGHDAKSIARTLGLSVHTVNERLREARRKLGVTSSREAARLLGAAERETPEFLGHTDSGVATDAAGIEGGAHQRRSVGPSLAWLGGGMIVMSLLIAAILLSPAFHDTSETQAPASAHRAPAVSTNEADAAGAGTARTWVALVDARNWADSWDTAGSLFKTQVTQAQWAATIEPVRQPLGAVSTRRFGKVTRTGTLPGAPAGDYELIEFATEFANRHGAVETVVLAREGATWRVDGYFIR